MRKNRKSHVFGHCLSTKTTPEVVDFDAAGLIGGIINAGKKPGLVFAKLYQLLTIIIWAGVPYHNRYQGLLSCIVAVKDPLPLERL
jgi:hypothetical protein